MNINIMLSWKSSRDEYLRYLLRKHNMSYLVLLLRRFHRSVNVFGRSHDGE